MEMPRPGEVLPQALAFLLPHELVDTLAKFGHLEQLQAQPPPQEAALW